MSSQREVLIRILALLQRKRLIETKNCTLKCLKWHYLTVRTMKNVAVLTGNGAFFLSPPRGIWQLKSPHPREFAIQGKKNAYAPGGGGGRRNWLMHNPFIYHFWQKKYPFRIPSTDKFYHFHLPDSWNMKNTSQNQNISSQVPPLFHSYKIHLVSPLGPFSRPKCQISIPLPFHHQLVKSYPFHIPDACLKKVPLSEGASPYRPF